MKKFLVDNYRMTCKYKTPLVKPFTYDLFISTQIDLEILSFSVNCKMKDYQIRLPDHKTFVRSHKVSRMYQDTQGFKFPNSREITSLRGKFGRNTDH